MGKSSIHIMPVKSGSESHNQRLQNLNYVREDLSHLNSSFILAPIAETRKDIETRYQESTGQKMQAKQTPIREGVLLIDEKHSVDDLKRVAVKLEERFGIRTIQAYAHKDEGHWNKETGIWKPNHHAHMVFDWTDKDTGKSLKLKREDLAEVQTLVAETLGLERGHASTKKHIESREYKVLKVEEEIKKAFKLQNGLPDAFKVIETAKETEKTIKPLKHEKNALEMDNAMLRANKNFLTDKNESLREENKKLELEKQNKNQMRR
ncbi:Mobilization protein [Dyadobacter flavalbus]|uniref:Mobilization protein n=1 Tax=Dyadobacter flavalbus TaxID=2579942 RepID=A0A5M8QKV3_9BACT|nr:Mobilization protein [Dyadobacter flavalbus]KAA6436817.1 Mobilization protein [Dyadobacter flavalbus]